MQKVDNSLDFNHWKFVANQPYDLLQQANSCDCGVFACLYARCLVTKSIMLSDQHSIPEFRKHMILELHSQVFQHHHPMLRRTDIMLFTMSTTITSAGQ